MSMDLADSDLCWVDVAEPPKRAPPANVLDEALHRDRVEFWFQPKIDLRQRRLVGVEGFARVRDAAGNLLATREVVARAPKSSQVALTEKAIVSILKTSANLAEIGVDVQLTINVSLEAMAALPVVEIVRKHRPDGGKCASLIFDMAEEDALGNRNTLNRISMQLRDSGLSLALDNFGASVLSVGEMREAEERIAETFAQLKRLLTVRFSEIKLHRSLVRNCAQHPDKQRICKHIIGLAHDMGSAVVAVGVERPAELRTLQALDCDIGQGYLFGRPMTEDEFLILLWERGVKSKQKDA
jgi:EAL domain-containing protein (putative c-di-GMP-specific phosphodiesterase class I)